jgi:hypothetical protein
MAGRPVGDQGGAMTEQAGEWFWGENPEVGGWVVAPVDYIEYDGEVPPDWDQIENLAGAIMADHLHGEDIEPYLTIVDNMGGPGERVFIETEADLKAIIAALEARGDTVSRNEVAASGLVSRVLVAGDVSVASEDLGCGTHDHDGACNLFWVTNGSVGLITNYCKLPAGHDSPHVCICGQQTDAATEPGAYFEGG